MEWLRLAIVLVLLGRAIYTDVKAGIIENKSMLAGLISGCVWSVVNDGRNGLFYSIKMVVITLLVLFVLYVAKGLGAGDIKLFCVLAAFYPDCVLEMIVVAFIAGAMIAIGKMGVRVMRKLPVYIFGETLNFSIPIGIGVLMIEVSRWIT